MSFGAKADDSRFNLIGFDDENQFADLRSEDGEPLSGKKYYMTSAAAARYGIAAGDTFCFYNTVTLEENCRNISMLEIPGYRDREVRSFVLSSGHLLVPVGFALGLPLRKIRRVDMAERGVGEGIRTCGVPREELFVVPKVAAEHKTYEEA